MSGQVRQFDGHRVLFWSWEVLPKDERERAEQIAKEIREIFIDVPCENLSQIATRSGLMVREKTFESPFAVV